MNRFQTFLSCVALCASLIIAAFQLFDGHWLSALISVACGCAVSVTLRYFGFIGFASENYRSVTNALMLIGLVAILITSNLFNRDLQHGYEKIAMTFPELERYCPRSTPGLAQAENDGLMACVQQNIRDATDATNEFQKNIHFGPTAILADSAAALTADGEANHCARAFKEALRLCPVAFSSLGENEQAALLNAAK